MAPPLPPAVSQRVAQQSQETRRSESTYLAQYRAALVRRHGKLTLPDLDTERTVPVEKIYVSPTIVVHEARAAVDQPEGLLELSRRVVLLGQPGGGKSTLAGVLTYRVALRQNGVPFVVTLRKYGKDFDEGRSFVQHIERMLNIEYQQEPPEGWVDRVLHSGDAVVVFDGLDELLDSSKRRDIRNAVSEFSHAYPFVRVVVTSRVVGYDQAPLSPREFILAELGEFREESVQAYVDKWFHVATTGLSSEERAVRIASFLRESTTVADLRSNPLLLSLMCVLYRGSNYIPETRLALYEECAKLLFKKWDKSREINVELEIGSDIDSSLMNFALWMLEQGHAVEGVTEAELVRVCAEHLVPRRYEQIADAERAAEEFVKFCRNRAWVLADAGSSETGESLYTFTHRTFLEYYTACQLARVCGTPEAIADRLAQRIASAEWDVVGQLALQIASKRDDFGADRLLTRLLDEATGGEGVEDAGDMQDGRIRTIEFACRSLQYMSPSPAVARRITQEAYSAGVISGLQRTGTTAQEEYSPPAMAAVAGAMQPALGVVGDELSVLARRDFARVEELTPDVNSRVLAFATFARNLADPPDHRRKEVFDFWSEWSRQVLTDFVWTQEHYDGAVPDAAMGLLEHGIIGLDKFVSKHPLEALWQGHTLSVLGLRRIATYELLHGWMVSEFTERLFDPGRPDSLLQQLAELMPSARLPFAGPTPELLTWRVAERLFLP